MRTSLEARNQQIIDAILAKAARECPGALAMVGIYGSCLTGDVHPRSDLDLLLLANDDRAQALACTFIQDDLGVGHDLYCTTWADLERDAAALHPHIAKLMDARIVWCADAADRPRLETLRESVRVKLAEPLSAATLARAQVFLRSAERCYADAMLSESPQTIRRASGQVIDAVEAALMSLNHRYFRRSTRRAYDELTALPRRPANLCTLLDTVTAARDAGALRDALTALLRAVRATFAEAERTLTPPQPVPTADPLRGVYEEIFSNWRSKLALAAQTGDRHLALLCLTWAQEMFGDIDCISGYDPDDLAATARGFDAALDKLAAQYARAGLSIRRFPHIDAFLREYQQKTFPDLQTP